MSRVISQHAAKLVTAVLLPLIIASCSSSLPRAQESLGEGFDRSDLGLEERQQEEYEESSS